jgi:hypothetical protein
MNDLMKKIERRQHFSRVMMMMNLTRRLLANFQLTLFLLFDLHISGLPESRARSSLYLKTVIQKLFTRWQLFHLISLVSRSFVIIFNFKMRVFSNREKSSQVKDCKIASHHITSYRGQCKKLKLKLENIFKW